MIDHLFSNYFRGQSHDTEMYLTVQGMWTLNLDEFNNLQV